MATGIEVRHQRRCRSLGSGRCNCEPSYRAHVWSNADRKIIRKTFPSHAAAKNWRHDAVVAVKHGKFRTAQPITLREAADEWLTGARAGLVLDRAGNKYKPSTVRGYDSGLRRVLPLLGDRRLADIRRRDLQDLVERLIAQGLSGATVRNTLNPVQAIYRRAVYREVVLENPTVELELPKKAGRRDRIADPAEAARLLAALPDDLASLWATALYAGLRRGELCALRWEDVDFDGGVIRVVRSWDPEVGEIEGKSQAARRSVPLVAELRKTLAAHKLRTGRSDGEFVFGKTGSEPFDPRRTLDRAQRCWKRAGLNPIGLHESRHTFASLLIASGVNPKALSTYMGHSSIQITFDQYGHLMPGSEIEAATKLDAFLRENQGKVNIAQ